MASILFNRSSEAFSNGANNYFMVGIVLRRLFLILLSLGL
jgi:hypothetical protein